MSTVKPKVLTLALLLLGSTGVLLIATSSSASAASVSGTWVSREAGVGYTQTYMGPSGTMVTEYFDIELTLSGSGSGISGTLVSTGYGHTQSYPVDGTFDGTTFLMTAYYGWDGVNYLTPVYTLTVSGNQMYGSGSYENVGVTIYGTFDLKKESLLGIDGITPMVSGVTIAISIVAIVVAAAPPKTPKGFRPDMARVPSPPSRYEPSQQWTTEIPPQPISGDGTVPVGGIGITQGSPVVRPMTDAETRATKAIPKPQRINAIGIAAVTMVMAVMVLFVEEEVAVIMPIFFSVASLGLAVQTTRSARAVSMALSKGYVVDVRETPHWTKTAGCKFGMFTIPRSGEMKRMLADGVPATVTVIPEAKRMIAVNGTILKRPVVLTVPFGFEALLASQAATQPGKASTAYEADVPPPPDDWVPSGYCPKCGKNAADGAVFCDSCGFRLKRN